MRRLASLGLTAALLTVVGAPLHAQDTQPKKTTDDDPVDPLVKEEYEVLKAMTPRTAADYYVLGNWAKKRGLKAESVACFEFVIEQETDHASARRDLGFCRLDGRWVTIKEFEEARPEEPVPGQPAPRIPVGEPREARVERERKAGKWKLGYPSKYYDFFSNGPEAKVAKIATGMDLMCEEYKKIFEYDAEITRPFPIHLYKNHKEFMKATGAGADKGGYYDGYKIVAFHGTLGRLGTMGILFHEGTHQFQGLVLGANMALAKPWLIEGLAVYYESSQIQGNSLKTGIVPRHRIPTLKATIRGGSYTPLKKLIREPGPGFNGLHYGQSWSLIYFLLETKGGKDRFDTFWNRIRDGHPSARNQAKLFETLFDKPMSEIEEAWKRFVMKKIK